MDKTWVVNPIIGSCPPTSQVPAILDRISWAKDSAEAAGDGFSGSLQIGDLGDSVWDIT